MALRADEILADAFSEITLRDPSFFDRQAVGFAPVADLVAGYRANPQFACFSDGQIEAALGRGQAFFTARGMRRADDVSAQARLAALINDTAIDALAAEAGASSLAAPARRAEPLTEVLARDYAARTTASGVNYVVRKGGTRWLLVVNAVGIPLGPWERLIGDASHDYKVLVVESGGCDLIKGGLSCEADLGSDTARIVEVLDAEGVDSLDVVGWCSGGRLAAQLAADLPGRVARLALISASFRGVSHTKGTQFEEDIAGIFDAVARSPESAGFLSELLMNSSKLAPPPLDDALLFRLPDKAHAGALVAPLASGDDLRLYARRVAADKAHATAEVLAAITAPILAIAGRHDQVVSNAHGWETLAAHAPQVSGAVISGAGHYGYDLQYPYFRLLLDGFTSDRPVTAARITAMERTAG